MHRVLNARFNASPPPPPLHSGPPLQVGETVLLRRPNSWADLLVELRAVDHDLALAVVRIRDRTERIPLCYLRRAGRA
jgi:hypothetical protein